MRLREATWPDLAAMAELEARCFPVDAWSPATFWGELAQRPQRSYWVATDGGDDAAEDAGEHPIGTPGEGLGGYAGVSTAGDVAEVMTIAVDPRRRGHGLGGRLLERLHEVATDRGAEAIILEVRADNPTAQQLYTSRGYAVVHTRRGYYRSSEGGPGVDALIMRKELT